MSTDQQQIINDLVLLKDRAHRAGLYRTARLIEIPLQEVGWEAQGESTPPHQKESQQKVLTP